MYLLRPKLNGDEKAAVRNLVLQLIQQYLNRTDAPPMIINRLCLALAGIGAPFIFVAS